MKKILSFLLLLPIFTAVEYFTIRPARAEWEYTQWGMSAEEVLQASEGAAVPVKNPKMTDDGQQTLLQSDWNSGKYQFEVLFNFIGSEPQLSEIVFVSQGNTVGLVDELKQRFGRPSRAVGQLQQTRKPPKFSLVDSETFARPANPPVSEPQPISVLVEWETPSNFIQLIRQSPTDVIIRLTPLEDGKANL
ncbi:hypothetical protein [Myxosarcina sp. GI1]|uniref:hypothetical protein n=1 Tax=Myxosarcina sp. GI1 TaxID=1541065 RepID=UPI000566103A|nr:hypothetical protein [Myxosarcina sp. GI1]